MNLHSTESQIAGTTVVSFEGPVDLATVGTLRDVLLASIRRHPGTTIAVDLDGVTVLDDTGLGILLGAAANARESGGEVTLVCSDADRRARLRRTRLDQAIDVRETIS
jgi:anti-sigma B factor antagonist